MEIIFAKLEAKLDAVQAELVIHRWLLGIVLVLGAINLGLATALAACRLT